MLEIINEDLTKIKVDVIVNASNGIGVLGAGIAGAIRKVGGKSIQDECKVYCDTFNPMPGHIFLTKAGDLPSYKVLHAVTMKYPGTNYSFNEEEGIKIVKRCLHNILTWFKQSSFSSLAIPGLATGIGGLDEDQVAQVFIDGIYYHGFFDNKDGKTVVICDINGDFLDCCNFHAHMKEESDGRFSL